MLPKYYNEDSFQDLELPDFDYTTLLSFLEAPTPELADQCVLMLITASNDVIMRVLRALHSTSTPYVDPFAVTAVDSYLSTPHPSYLHLLAASPVFQYASAGRRVEGIDVAHAAASHAAIRLLPCPCAHRTLASLDLHPCVATNDRVGYLLDIVDGVQCTEHTEADCYCAAVGKLAANLSRPLPPRPCPAPARALAARPTRAAREAGLLLAVACRDKETVRDLWSRCDLREFISFDTLGDVCELLHTKDAVQETVGRFVKGCVDCLNSQRLQDKFLADIIHPHAQDYFIVAVETVSALAPAAPAAAAAALAEQPIETGLKRNLLHFAMLATLAASAGLRPALLPALWTRLRTEVSARCPPPWLPPTHPPMPPNISQISSYDANYVHTTPATALEVAILAPLALAVASQLAVRAEGGEEVVRWLAESVEGDEILEAACEEEEKVTEWTPWLRPSELGRAWALAPASAPAPAQASENSDKTHFYCFDLPQHLLPAVLARSGTVPTTFLPRLFLHPCPAPPTTPLIALGGAPLLAAPVEVSDGLLAELDDVILTRFSLADLPARYVALTVCPAAAALAGCAEASLALAMKRLDIVMKIYDTQGSYKSSEMLVTPFNASIFASTLREGCARGRPYRAPRPADPSPRDLAQHLQTLFYNVYDIVRDHPTLAPHLPPPPARAPWTLPLWPLPPAPAQTWAQAVGAGFIATPSVLDTDLTVRPPVTGNHGSTLLAAWARARAGAGETRGEALAALAALSVALSDSDPTLMTLVREIGARIGEVRGQMPEWVFVLKLWLDANEEGEGEGEEEEEEYEENEEDGEAVVDLSHPYESFTSISDHFDHFGLIGASHLTDEGGVSAAVISAIVRDMLVSGALSPSHAPTTPSSAFHYGRICGYALAHGHLLPAPPALPVAGCMGGRRLSEGTYESVLAVAEEVSPQMHASMVACEGLTDEELVDLGLTLGALDPESPSPDEPAKPGKETAKALAAALWREVGVNDYLEVETEFMRGYDLFVSSPCDVPASFYARALAGQPLVSASQLAEIATYGVGIDASHPLVRLFWEYMSTCDCGRVLEFVTGSPRLPLLGASGLKYSEDAHAFSITTTTRPYPTASVCFNILRLPISARSLQDMKEKFEFALQNMDGFGDD